MEKINDILDNTKKLQDLIESKEWQNDNMGILINKAIRICLDADATEGEAYEYLELS